MALFYALTSGTDAWKRIDAQYDTQRSLRTAETALLADLKETNATQLRFKRITSPAGNGDVLWFLSAKDPTVSGPNVQKFVRDPAAMPVWQRTIIYYLIRPSNHDAMAGFSCGVDGNAAGDAFCPHKFLVRKVVNGAANPETLMSAGAVDAYVTPPAGFDTSSFASEAGLEDAKIVSDRLMGFRVTRPAGSRMVTIDLSGVRLREARNKIQLGTSDLSNSQFTVYHQLKVLPQNQ